MKNFLLQRTLLVILMLNLGFAVCQNAVVLAQRSAPTDDLITDNVRLKLASDPDVKGGAIQVDVRQGVVTLTGVVETQKIKMKAEKISRKVKGVKQVVNKLTTRSH